MSSIDAPELDAAVEDHSNWKLLDDTLYGLCRQHPGHAHAPATNAKLWLIGRGFATGIERQISSKGGQGSSMQTLCNHFNSSHEKIDEAIGLLAGVAEPLDQDKLKTISAAHGRFCRLLKPVVRKGVVPRSFAAKYLHFHCPAVPIYDSYADWKLKRLFRWRSDYKLYDPPKEADDYYHWFLMRFWQAYQAARELRPAITVRDLDLYLLWPLATTT